MGDGERDSLFSVPLHCCIPGIVLCLFQQHPEVLIFSVKKRGGECVGHSAVPIRVPQKSWDPCLCGNSGALGVCHSLKHTNKHTAFFFRNLSALNKKSFHRKVSSESFLLDSRCWFLLCIFLTCQLFINYVFK